MAEIGIKELKATTSAVIDKVEGGSAYVVTKRGQSR
jgi:antitoxin (DNA-binding transcriptional repressor) of toxin-antitoxin stability system